MTTKYEGMPEVGEWSLDIADLIFEKEPFAKGAFGKVYKADYFGTSVCVKVICKEIPNEREYSKFTQREVAALKSLSHPNLVQFIGANEDHNLIYLVTEFISGGTLRKHLKNFKEEIPWHIRVQVASDVSSAMAFLHSRKIMHRDLKSKNLLVSDNWKIKICDFGFARSIKDRKHARHMTLCGTEEYMAPEVIFGMEYDEKAEVYSFGLLMCELITRQKVEETVPRTPLTNFGLDVKAFQALIPADCPTQFVQLAFSCVAYEAKFRPDFKEVSRTLRNMSDNMKENLKNAPRPGSPRVDNGNKSLPAPPASSGDSFLTKSMSPPTSTDSPTTAQRTGSPSNGADSPPVNGAEPSKAVAETAPRQKKTPPPIPSRVGRPALSIHPTQNK